MADDKNLYSNKNYDSGNGKAATGLIMFGMLALLAICKMMPKP